VFMGKMGTYSSSGSGAFSFMFVFSEDLKRPRGAGWENSKSIPECFSDCVSISESLENARLEKGATVLNYLYSNLRM
jgi:hypothetical protein